MPTEPTPAWVLARRRAVGEHIRATRLHRNWSQEKLAEAAGLDRQAINRIENGIASTRLDSLFRIADALDVPAWSLLT
ncbi:helix-turn-helix transcriptional regulator [Streptomyces roseoverticillatus]|uniref:helix-turn-helix domain-containing protein n=1 Tax=Streptomyces roseoverticillatus TaxID=66429 RepID=UPI001F469FE6|nr:helix-turn-helix transcriptional regulator [Streptomyces roseoverticillatus]MCF3101406.1 helix-turn-helix transcriptional regulator [Streptomyces roseoverticillatus]